MGVIYIHVEVIKSQILLANQNLLLIGIQRGKMDDIDESIDRV